MSEWHPQHEVFINFRGKELRGNFISHLKRALERGSIKVYIDEYETMGNDLKIFFERIKQSRIVIVVISRKYTESSWCLDELAMVKECVEARTLKVFPVFYKMDVRDVREQRGSFGDKFRDLAKSHPAREEPWKQALEFATNRKGNVVKEESDEGQEVENIVKDVKLMLKGSQAWGKIRDMAIGKKDLLESSSSSDSSSFFGMETRLKQLEEKLDFKSKTITRIVGVVGMPGIGKTTLAMELWDKWKTEFLYTTFLYDIREKSREFQLLHEGSGKRLHEDLLKGLRESRNEQEKTDLPFITQIRNIKVFFVLDDVSDKTQIEEILRERDWICEGSKIVITTSRKSAIEGIVHDTYLVPGLSEIDALSHFRHHAFPGRECSREESFMKLAREFVDFCKGHPLALKVLGGELSIKDEVYWESMLGTLSTSPISMIYDVLRIPYKELSESHKNVFLDIACFFRFDDEYHVRSLLDSSTENVSEIRDLADKFFINICGGRVEMNDLLYTFAMRKESQSSSENSSSRCRLFNQGDIISVLLNKAETTKVRGIFLDMSEVQMKRALPSNTFSNMKDLRYLKFFNSRCIGQCEDDCKLKFPDGLDFSLQEIRYLHWLKFPSLKLPQNFNSKNLIDLKLPYSQIEQVWEGDKDTLKLKWLDLNHSSKLCTLSGLSRARNLLNMNLEGCTALKTVHELQNMNSLAFLNLRGCTSLESLPKLNLISLKKLILSGCSNLVKFDLISENLEELYLDGTAIKELPSAIGDFQRLVVLNLKDCKNLSSLPDSIGNLKAIQELTLSGCSSLASFPKIKEDLKHLKTLLLDGTAIKEMPEVLHRLVSDQGQTSSCSHCKFYDWPRGLNGLLSLQRLCLSRNELRILPRSISDLFHLKWFDLKYCENLISLPMLPPNLRWLDAHGCISLEKVDNQLAHILVETEHLHTTFIFSNCNKLDQDAENSIVSYAQRKIKFMKNALARYDEGCVLGVLIGICFPGWQVPAWFNHRSVGSVLVPDMPRHWSDNGLTGIALCVVVSFKDYKAQSSRILVRCNCKFKEEDKPPIKFSCILGGWTEHGSEEPRTIKSGHVFLGYTSWLHIKKHDRGGKENKKGCFSTEASLEFEVTDGTGQVTNCEVLKCGFSLIYALTDPLHSLCTDAAQPTNNHTYGRSSSHSTNDIERNIRGQETYYNKNRNGVNSDLLVASNMDNEVREEVRVLVPSRTVKDTQSKGKSTVVSTTGSNSEAVHRGETSRSSSVDSNLNGGSTQTIADTSPNGSINEENIKTDAKGIACLSFLQVFLQFLRREKTAIN